MTLPDTQEGARNLLRLALSGQTENPVRIDLGASDSDQEGPPAMTTQPAPQTHSHEHAPQEMSPEQLYLGHTKRVMGETVADLAHDLAVERTTVSLQAQRIAQLEQQIAGMQAHIEHLSGPATAPPPAG